MVEILVDQLPATEQQQLRERLMKTMGVFGYFAELSLGHMVASGYLSGAPVRPPTDDFEGTVRFVHETLDLIEKTINAIPQPPSSAAAAVAAAEEAEEAEEAEAA